jgi:tetratricopeptide (TPR) repeat protein
VEELESASLRPEMFLSGMLRALAGEPEGERSAYYRGLIAALRPGIFGELREAALFKARNGDYAAALDIFDLLEGLCPRHPAPLLHRALVLDARAQGLEKTAAADSSGAERALAEAEAAYERALSVIPAAPPGEGAALEALFYAGLFYERRGNYRRCAGCLRLYLAGRAEDDAGDDPASAEAERRRRAKGILETVRREGLDDEALEEAAALVRKGDEEGGIRRARDFLERHPGAGKGWFVLGWGLRRLSRWEDGAACFEKALERGILNADVYNELAICRMEGGDLERAERELEKALRLDPENVKIISNMGVLALRRGEGDRAAGFFRAALELDPGDPVAAKFFAEPEEP